MRVKTDEQGRLTVKGQMPGGEWFSFALTADSGIPFLPHTEIEIDRDRIVLVTRELLAPAGGFDEQAGITIGGGHTPDAQAPGTGPASD